MASAAPQRSAGHEVCSAARHQYATGSTAALKPMPLPPSAQFFFFLAFLLDGHSASWAFFFFLAIFWGPGFTGTLRVAEGLKEGTGRGASDMGDTAEVAGWAYRCRKRWLSMWQSAKVKPIPVPKWHPQLNHLLGICEGLCNTPCIRLIKIGIVAQNCGETLGNNSKLRK